MPTSSAARRESAHAMSAWPAIVRRSPTVSSSAAAIVTAKTITYCGCTTTPPMFQARSNTAE